MIPGLDGLRAIAFLMVYFIHTGNLGFGWAGVELFYVLSGFLITDILLTMKEKLPPGEFFLKFYGRRFLRIFPLYYFYLFLLVILIYSAAQLNLKGLRNEIGIPFLYQIKIAFFYLYDFFYASSWFEESHFISHMWSLSVEEQFYLIWPLVILLTPREKFKQLCLSSIGLGLLFRLAITLLYSNHLLPSLVDDPYRAIYALPFSYLDAFAFGAYITRFKIPYPRLQLTLTTLLIIATGIFMDISVEGSVTTAIGYAFPLNGFYKEVWGYTLLNYFFMLLIYCVARTNFLTSILDLPPFRYLGKISYGLYVYHFGIIALTFAIFKAYNLDYPIYSFEFFLVSMGATLLIASLSFYLLEKPIINLKDKFFRV